MQAPQSGQSVLYRLLRGAVPNVVALLLGILAAAILMVILGINPVKVFSIMFGSALGTQTGQSYILTYAATLTLSGLAFTIPGMAGIWNVGAQGQIFLGGITAALVTVFVPLPPILWPIVATAAAIGAGAVWALIPGILEAYRNSSAIVTTLMMNYIGQPLASFLLYYFVVIKIPQVNIYTTAPFTCVPASQYCAATLPSLPYFTTSIMIILAVAVAIGSLYFLNRTTLGYNIRAAGLGPQPATAKGINPKTMKIIAMVIGGAIAGLAGAGDVLGAGHACGINACYADGFAQGWFGGEGFAGIAVALVAANNPIAIIFSSIFFSIMVAGAPAVGASGSFADEYVVWAMQGIIILFMAMPYLSRRILNLGGKRRWT